MDNIKSSLSEVKTKSTESKEVCRKTIEAWQDELQFKPYVFIAAKLKNKWTDGKSLTKSEFEKGIEGFLKSKAGGK